MLSTVVQAFAALLSFTDELFKYLQNERISFKSMNLKAKAECLGTNVQPCHTFSSLPSHLQPCRLGSSLCLNLYQCCHLVVAHHLPKSSVILRLPVWWLQLWSLRFLLLSQNTDSVLPVSPLPLPPPPQGDVEPEPARGAKRSAAVRRLGTAGSATGKTSATFLVNLRD